MARFDFGVYNRLSAASHAGGAHTVALQPGDNGDRSDDGDDDDFDTQSTTTSPSSSAMPDSTLRGLCFSARSVRVVQSVAEMDARYLICRADITMITRVFA